MHLPLQPVPTFFKASLSAVLDLSWIHTMVLQRALILACYKQLCILPAAWCLMESYRGVLTIPFLSSCSGCMSLTVYKTTSGVSPTSFSGWMTQSAHAIEFLPKNTTLQEAHLTQSLSLSLCLPDYCNLFCSHFKVLYNPTA